MLIDNDTRCEYLALGLTILSDTKSVLNTLFISTFDRDISKSIEEMETELMKLSPFIYSKQEEK
jgi:hypothetical protein